MPPYPLTSDPSGELNAHLAAIGWSARTLAARTGYSPSTISLYLSRRPPPASLLAYVRAVRTAISLIPPPSRLGEYL
jgi:lambda repressor-like predicted transcriptional regulator